MLFQVQVVKNSILFTSRIKLFMKKYCLIVLFTLLLIISLTSSNLLFGQGVFHIGEKPLIDTIIIPHDKIIYVIPDSLEKSIAHTVDIKDVNYSAFVLISSTPNANSDVIGLSFIIDYMLFCENIDIRILKIAERSNRFLLIKNRFYPILFDSDLFLSDFKKSNKDVNALIETLILNAKHNKLYVEFDFNYMKKR